jgi:hypothetical protein
VQRQCAVSHISTLTSMASREQKPPARAHVAFPLMPLNTATNNASTGSNNASSASLSNRYVFHLYAELRRLCRLGASTNATQNSPFTFFHDISQVIEQTQYKALNLPFVPGPLHVFYPTNKVKRRHPLPPHCCTSKGVAAQQKTRRLTY